MTRPVPQIALHTLVDVFLIATGREHPRAMSHKKDGRWIDTVSYTHLTLPTIYSV